jgi:hypothetical protein
MARYEPLLRPVKKLAVEPAAASCKRKVETGE